MVVAEDRVSDVARVGKVLDGSGWFIRRQSNKNKITTMKLIVISWDIQEDNLQNYFFGEYDENRLIGKA